MKQPTKFITFVTTGVTLISIISIYFISTYGISPFQRIYFESKIVSHKYGGERSEYLQISIRPDLKVNREQLEKKFQFSPFVSFDVVSKSSGITIIFNQTLLANTKYTVSLANELYPQFSYTFKTPPIQILSIINVEKKT